ncbi:hypothetical protein Hanom_Chr08g00732691 [Helianthus anomalus]
MMGYPPRTGPHMIGCFYCFVLWEWVHVSGLVLFLEMKCADLSHGPTSLVNHDS